MKIRTTIALGALGVTLLLAGCSSSSSSDSKSTTTQKGSTSSTADKSTTVPTIAGITKSGTKSLTDGGIMTSYTTTGDASTVISTFEAALKKDGYTVDGSGGGGSGRWGGAGLTATTANSYVVVSAGGSTSKMYVDVCVWPSKPKNDDCGDNDSQDQQNQNQQN